MNTQIVAGDWVNECAHYQMLANEIVQRALIQGANQAEVAISHSLGFTVNVRLGEVETVEHHRDKVLALTIYSQQRKGAASSSDFSPRALSDMVTAACHIAQLSQTDPCVGLAEARLMAKDYPDLALYHPSSLGIEQAIELAQECETKARAVDTRIITSEGAHLASHCSFYVYANSHGFTGAYPSSHYSLDCSLVAQDKQGMQRDGSYTRSRDPQVLQAIDQLAREAGERTVRRLGARRLKTCQVPVIFQAEIAHSLIGSFLAAISGDALYRRASFLLDRLGKPVFADHIHICERPHLVKGLGSAPFDEEGVATWDRDLVVQGVLQGYLLDSYAARKLGLQTTGNAGGVHNVILRPSGDGGLETLLQQLDTGLLITELMGQGINLVTGDYSRGACGFWVEKGCLQYPVEEITVAGNLCDMYQRIIAVGNDQDLRHTIITGSILIEDMIVAGE